MKLLVFGSLNIDHDYHMDHIAKEKETTFADEYTVVAGGKGLNGAIALARSSAHVYLAGNIGNDAALLEKVLLDNHVDISLLNHVDEPNGHAIIQLDKKGENSIFVYGGSNQHITTEYIDKVLENFSAGDLLVLQNEINNMPYLIKTAHDKGLVSIFNPSPINDLLQTYPLELIDYYFINEVEGKALTGVDSFDNMLDEMEKKFPNSHIIMTVGAEGAYYRYKNETLFQPAYKVNAVDTVGAGDTFMGYFTYGLSQSLQPQQCLQLAAKASSITVTRVGAADSIPTIDEVNAK